MVRNTAHAFRSISHLTRPNRPEGQGLLEFALVLPVILFLIFGVMEMGRLLFVYSAVFTASREAARYGSAAGDNGSGVRKYQDCAGMRLAAERMGSLAGIQDSNIMITYDQGPNSTPYPSRPDGCPPTNIAIEGAWHRVVVTISTNYQPVLPLVNIPAFTITSKSARSIFKNITPDITPLTPTPAP